MRKFGRNNTTDIEEKDQEGYDDEDEIIRTTNQNDDNSENDNNDQDKFLFESNFTEEKGPVASFHSKYGEDDK